MSVRGCLRFIICLMALALNSWADQVNLSNGDRVTGKLVKKDGDNLTVKTDLMGEVTIPWKSVVSVNSQEPVTVVLTTGRSLVGPVSVDAKEEKVEVVTATSRESARLSELVAIRNAETQKQHERMEKPGLLDLWASSVDLGISGARGNARTNTFTIAAAASRETRTDKTAAYFQQIYSSALVDGVSAATAEAIRGGWSYNRNVKPRLLWNLFNDYEYDRFQSLDLRVVLGSGLGYTIIKQERKRLDLLGGAAYNHEEFNTPLTRNSAEGYWGDDFTYKPSRIAELQQRLRVFHNQRSGLLSYQLRSECRDEPEEPACLAFDTQRPVAQRARGGPPAQRCALHYGAAIALCAVDANTVKLSTGHCDSVGYPSLSGERPNL